MLIEGQLTSTPTTREGLTSKPMKSARHSARRNTPARPSSSRGTRGSRADRRTGWRAVARRTPRGSGGRRAWSQAICSVALRHRLRQPVSTNIMVNDRPCLEEARSSAWTAMYKKWRSDWKCGPNHPAPDGTTPSKCNPNGHAPCCSKWGWCGSTDQHCSWGSYLGIDYR